MIIAHEQNLIQAALVAQPFNKARAADLLTCWCEVYPEIMMLSDPDLPVEFAVETKKRVRDEEDDDVMYPGDWKLLKLLHGPTTVYNDDYMMYVDETFDEEDDNVAEEEGSGDERDGGADDGEDEEDDGENTVDVESESDEGKGKNKVTKD